MRETAFLMVLIEYTSAMKQKADDFTPAMKQNSGKYTSAMKQTLIFAYIL